MDVGHNLFNEIISLENLLAAWKEFRRGKRAKPDVQDFEFNLEDNLFRLHWELQNGFYRHGVYQRFTIRDPKFRIIHKASVRDRVVHHAVFRILYPVFDDGFIFDSYSCRIGKGTHEGVKCLTGFAVNVSRNFRRQCFALKCDIRKFFDSMNHEILKKLLARRVSDSRVLNLLAVIIDSFSTVDNCEQRERERELKGFPIGNLVSQLFANIYLHELDKFVKEKLQVRYYLRYTDDFIFMHKDKNYLEGLVPQIGEFLRTELKLSLHPKKIILRKLSAGIDFLGYVILPYHRVLRTKTKRRMLRKVQIKIQSYNAGEISRKELNQTIQSYYGMLKHCNSAGLKRTVRRKAVMLGVSN